MANFVSGYQRHVDAFSDFVFVHDIDSLSDEQLDAHGYYRGFVCPHGHYIRNKDKHWCYECVRKIMNNNCGFDINYMHGQYKIKLLSLWERITIGEPDECWDSHTLTTPRVNIPSYRSLNKPRVTDNINVHKVIYHCAWEALIISNGFKTTKGFQTCADLTSRRERSTRGPINRGVRQSVTV